MIIDEGPMSFAVNQYWQVCSFQFCAMGRDLTPPSSVVEELKCHIRFVISIAASLIDLKKLLVNLGAFVFL